jgi:hypothetical protein
MYYTIARQDVIIKSSKKTNVAAIIIHHITDNTFIKGGLW